MPILERILCVEDDPDSHAVIRLGLEIAGGFKLHLCSSGGEALDVARTFRPHLAVISMEVPGADGLHTLDALRRQPGNTSLPAILMTDGAKQDKVPAPPGQGVLAVISKPLDPMRLALEIRTHWLRHHGTGCYSAEADS